jgi:hypothetical protein|tara:strand:+ start:342 stop:1157 length:816 start_codon:yes stop_codon:yes gene_type:complete
VKSGARRILLASALGAILCAPAPAIAEPFRFIRIGDKDGFGFTDTKELIRSAFLAPDAGGPADTDGDGMLTPGEFLPDLNRDGVVRVYAGDDFDNRFPAELLDRAIFCEGCSKVHGASRGSNWTDLSLSASAPDKDWPDEDGPLTPNNAVFVFDFTVKNGDIPPGAAIFFNMVFGDYDIFPAVIQVEFASAPARRLEIELQRGKDGLIQARTALLRFEDVFSRDENGDWRGFAGVEFFAPAEPYTAFDFVELSLFQIAAGGRIETAFKASR